MEGEDELVISTLLRLNESFNKDLSNLYLQIEKSIDVSQALDLAASKKLVKAPQVSLFLLSLVTTSNSNEEVFLRICHDVISDLNHQDLLGAYRIGKKINTQAPSPVVHSFSQPHSPPPFNLFLFLAHKIASRIVQLSLRSSCPKASRVHGLKCLSTLINSGTLIQTDSTVSSPSQNSALESTPKPHTERPLAGLASGYLTPYHSVFLQLCLLTEEYAAGVPCASSPIVDLLPSRIAPTTSHHAVAYYHAAGCLLLATAALKPALSALFTCFTLGKAPSSFALDAFRKWLIASTFLAPCTSGRDVQSPMQAAFPSFRHFSDRGPGGGLLDSSLHSNLSPQLKLVNQVSDFSTCIHLTLKVLYLFQTNHTFSHSPH